MMKIVLPLTEYPLMLGDKGVLDVEDTHHAYGDLVVNDRLVALTNNVDTKLQIG